MINKANGKKKNDGPAGDGPANDHDADVVSEQDDQDQNNLMKNASHLIQEIFGGGGP